MRTNADGVVLTILTGRRPELLRQTLNGLLVHSVGLLDTAYVVILHNGGDEDTDDVVVEYGDYWDRVLGTPTLAPIAAAAEILADAAIDSGMEYWMHLEDDWLATGSHKGWLDDARTILEDHHEVAQVRLRLASEPVLSKHMVTREPLVWDDLGRYSVSPSAHRTHNPSLQRTKHARFAYPAMDEKDMQRNWMAAGLLGSAQLTPGEFAHLGEGDLSLKWSLRGRAR